MCVLRTRLYGLRKLSCANCFSDHTGAHLTAGRDGFASGKVPKEQKHRDRQKRPQKRHIDAIVAALIRDGGQNRREAENHGGQKDENNAGELILFHIRDQPL